MKCHKMFFILFAIIRSVIFSSTLKCIQVNYVLTFKRNQNPSINEPIIGWHKCTKCLYTLFDKDDLILMPCKSIIADPQGYINRIMPRTTVDYKGIYDFNLNPWYSIVGD